MNMVFASTCLYLVQFYFSVYYNFLSTHDLHSWLNLFLGIVLFFEATVNGIIFLNSFSDSSLLACKTATDFWILILYLDTLLISFISSINFLVDSLWFSIYSIMAPTNNDSFTSQILIPSISFYFLIVVARTSSTM